MVVLPDKIDGDPWSTWWFNHLPGPSISPKRTPMVRLLVLPTVLVASCRPTAPPPPPFSQTADLSRAESSRLEEALGWEEGRLQDTSVKSMNLSLAGKFSQRTCEWPSFMSELPVPPRLTEPSDIFQQSLTSAEEPGARRATYSQCMGVLVGPGCCHLL